MKIKKTYYPCTLSGKNGITKEPKKPKIGDRFEVLVIQEFNDKTFPAGSKATFLGWGETRDYGFWYYRWPRFQFDGDSHTRRILEFKELKKI